MSKFQLKASTLQKHGLRQLAKYLIELGDGKRPYLIQEGICSNCSLEHQLGWAYFEEHLTEFCFMDWPYWSGCDAYPVPDPESKASSGTIFYEVDKWADNEYAKLRRNLARHMGEWLYRHLGKQ